jgi:hypothetical protein
MAVMFALIFGIAYAGGGLGNGVTDFSGKSHGRYLGFYDGRRAELYLVPGRNRSSGPGPIIKKCMALFAFSIMLMPLGKGERLFRSPEEEEDGCDVFPDEDVVLLY